MLDWFVLRRKQLAHLQDQLQAPLRSERKSPFFAVPYRLIEKISEVAIAFVEVLIEIPIHWRKSPTESFMLLAKRDAGQTFLESYSDYLRRYRLSIVTSLTLLFVVIGQVIGFGWSLYRVGKPAPALAATITISGTLYSGEGTGVIDCSGVGNERTVAISINGGAPTSGDCTVVGGTYSINVSVAAMGDVVTVFLDGETEDAVTVTRTADAVSNITGVDLYQNRLIVRHEDSGPTTNANLGQYDNDNDLDIPYTSNTNNLLVLTGTELHVWSGKTFDAGGDVDTNATGGDLHLDDNATVEIDTATSTIGRDVLVDTGSTYRVNADNTIDGGDLTTAGTGIVTTTAGTPTITINNTGMIGGGSGSITVHNLTFGSGTHTFGSSFTVNNNLTLAGSVTAGSTTVTMAGTAGTIVGGGTSLNNLTIDPTSTGTTTLNTSDVTVAGTLTVATGDTLSLSASRTLTHSGATLTLNGTISGAGTIIYQSATAFPTGGTISSILRMDATNNNQSLGARTYGGVVTLYSNSSAADRTITLGTGASQTLTFSSDFNPNANNNKHIIVDGDTNDPTVNITGNLDFTGTGVGIEVVSAGAGTWTVTGSVNLTDGVYGPTVTALTTVWADTGYKDDSYSDICAVSTSYGCSGANVDVGQTNDAGSCDIGIPGHIINSRAGMEFNPTGIDDGATILGTALAGNLTVSYSGAISIGRATTDVVSAVSCFGSSGVWSKLSGTQYGTAPFGTTGGKLMRLGLTGAADIQSRITGTTARLTIDLTTGDDNSLNATFINQTLLITSTTTTTPTLTMNGSGQTLTSAGNPLYNLNLAGTVTIANEILYVAGDLNMTGGDVTPGSSTIYLTGVGKTLTAPAGGDTLTALTIDPASSGTITFAAGGGDLTVSGTLTVASGDTLSLGAGRTLTLSGTSGTTLVLSGTISGGGRLTYMSTTVFPATGTISSILRLDATSGSQTIGGTNSATRTFGGVVEIYSNSSSAARTVTLENGTSRTFAFANSLFLIAANTQNITLTGDTTTDPTVNVTGDIDFTGTGSGTEIITSGNGVWTASANVNFGGGTYTATSGNQLKMNGTGSLFGNSQSLYKLTVDGSGNTVTLTDQVTVTNALTVGGAADSNDDTLTLSAFLISSSTGSVVFGGSGTDTINGNSMLFLRNDVIDTDGVFGGNVMVKYDTTQSAGSMNVVGRQYRYLEIDNFLGEPGETVVLGSGGGQTITVDLDFTISCGGCEIGGTPNTIGGDTFNPTVNVTGSFITGDDFALGGHPISMGVGTWTVGGDFNLSYAGTFNHNNSTLVMNGTGTLTSNGKTLGTLQINTSGTVTLAAATHTVNGNFLLGGSGTPTVTGSTILMNGTGGKTIDGGGKTVNNLTIDPTTTATVTHQNTDLTVSGTLTVATGDLLSLNGGRTLSATGTTTLNGTITGTGTLRFVSTSSGPGTTGTLSAPVRYDLVNGDIGAATIDARTYNNQVEIYHGVSGTATATLAAGTYILSGPSSHFIMNGSGTFPCQLSVDGATNNPTITAGGNIDYINPGFCTIMTTSGNGTWTTSGDFLSGGGMYLAGDTNTLVIGGSGDLATGTYSRGTGSIVRLNGSGTFTSTTGVSLHHLELLPTGTITLSGSITEVVGNLVLSSGGAIAPGTMEVSMAGGSQTIDGGGKTLSTLSIWGSATLQNSDLTVANLNINGTTLTLNSGRILTHTGATFTSSGTITGAGTLRFTDTSSGPGTSGTLSSVVRYDASAANIAATTFDARTYGGRVELYNGGAGNNTVSCVNAASTYLLSGSSSHLYLMADGTGSLTLDCDDATDPNMTIGGDLDFTGVGAGAESITAGSGTWTVTGNVNTTGGTYTAAANNLLTTSGNMNLSGNYIRANNSTVRMTAAGTMTSGGNDLENVELLPTGTVTLGDSLVVYGNIVLGSNGVLDAGTRVVTWAGASKTIDGGGQTLFRLDVSSGGTNTLQNSNVSVSILTVDSGSNFVLNTGRVITVNGSISLVSTISGAGTLVMTNTSSGPGSSGTLTANVRYDASAGNILSTIFDARTYGGQVELYSASGSDRTVACVDAATYTLSGATSHLHLQAAGTGGLALECNTTTDPALVIGGNLGFTGAGSGSETITAGGGTWTVSGNVDFTGGSFTAANDHLLTMNGTSKTVTSSGQTLPNLTLGGSTTITDATTIGAHVTINGGASLTAPAATLTIGGNFTNNGTFVHNSGTVALSGLSTAVISGPTTFHNLTSSVAGKTIRFQRQTAGAPVFTFDGLLAMSGSAGNPITIESDLAGTQWLASFVSAQSSVSYLALKDSGCAGGSASITLNGTNTNNGNNGSCWNFLAVNVSVADGPGSDIDFTSDTTALSANWTAAGQGADHFEYAVGTTSGGNDIIPFTNNGLVTSFTRTGLSLVAGTTYYTTVRTYDSVNALIGYGTSDGVLVSASLPNITDNQPNDTTPRRAAGTTYDVDFSKAATGQPLSIGEYTVYTGAGKTGTRIKDWTAIFNEQRDAYTTNWEIDFRALSEGTSYVSVRVTTTDGVMNALDDAFTVLKRTPATGPTLMPFLLTGGQRPTVVVQGFAKGSQTVQLFLDGRVYATFRLPGTIRETKSFTANIDLTKLKVGRHELYAQTTDLLGRVSDIKDRRTFRVTLTNSRRSYLFGRVSNYLVANGDSLWRIASTFLGHGQRYTDIAVHNAIRFPSLLRKPWLILPNWFLSLPR